MMDEWRIQSGDTGNFPWTLYRELQMFSLHIRFCGWQKNSRSSCFYDYFPVGVSPYLKHITLFTKFQLKYHDLMLFGCLFLVFGAELMVFWCCGTPLQFNSVWSHRKHVKIWKVPCYRSKVWNNYDLFIYFLYCEMLLQFKITIFYLNIF